MVNKTDEEEIRYFIRPHITKPNQKVVTVYCGRLLVLTFYMHSYQGKKFCVLTSKHLKEIYTDYKNPIAPGVIIDLSGDSDEVELGEELPEG
jgi:hypothetical protein